jgi:hypothetical protein
VSGNEHKEEYMVRSKYECLVRSTVRKPGKDTTQGVISGKEHKEKYEVNGTRRSAW